MGVWTTTREVVKSALGNTTNQYDAQIDRAIETGSRTVEARLHRIFYPNTTTKYFDWPNDSYARSYRLWLDQNELISITSLVSGGITIPASNYFLEPNGYGPPYDHLDLDLADNSSFSTVNTFQRSIAITGVFGYNLDSASAGAITAAIVSTSATTLSISDSSLVGVGSLLTIDSERLIVSAKSWVTSSQTVQTSALTALASNTTVLVTTGSSFNVGEYILIDSEKMLITDIVGNSLIVKRAVDGTVLATHNTGTTIYLPRTLTVSRGALGTTAATHLISTAVTQQVYPGPVAALTVAYAMNQVMQEGAGYARIAGSGDNSREFTGRGIKDLERDAIAVVGRQCRVRAV